MRHTQIILSSLLFIISALMLKDGSDRLIPISLMIIAFLNGIHGWDCYKNKLKKQSIFFITLSLSCGLISILRTITNLT